MKEQHARAAKEHPEKVVTADVGGRQGPDVVLEGEWTRDGPSTRGEAGERQDRPSDVPTTSGETGTTTTATAELEGKWLKCTECWRMQAYNGVVNRCCNAMMEVHTMLACPETLEDGEAGVVDSHRGPRKSRICWNCGHGECLTDDKELLQNVFSNLTTTSLTVGCIVLFRNVGLHFEEETRDAHARE